MTIGAKSVLRVACANLTTSRPQLWPREYQALRTSFWREFGWRFASRMPEETASAWRIDPQGSFEDHSAECRLVDRPDAIAWASINCQQINVGRPMTTSRARFASDSANIASGAIPTIGASAR